MQSSGIYDVGQFNRGFHVDENGRLLVRDVNEAPYVLVVDQKADGVSGGTFTAGDWRTRDINTELVDTDNLASISSNQITLQAGTWEFFIKCPCIGVLVNRARFQNITDGVTVALSVMNIATAGDSAHPAMWGRFTISVPKVFEIQHWGELTAFDVGFGDHDQGIADDVLEEYTRAEFRKVGQ